MLTLKCFLGYLANIFLGGNSFFLNNFCKYFFQSRYKLTETKYYDKKEQLPKLEEELKFLLITKDPDDDKNIICEVRAGAEEVLSAGTLFRMYSMYAEKKHWKVEILNENETGLGGYKEISFMITGKGVYSRLKFKSGVHRV